MPQPKCHRAHNHRWRDKHEGLNEEGCLQEELPSGPSAQCVDVYATITLVLELALLISKWAPQARLEAL